jgi:hypothetical protein
MKREKSLQLLMFMALITTASLVIAILLTQMPAHAAVDCSTVSSTSTTDSDLDGLTINVF